MATARHSRIGGALSGTRGLVRLVYRDPEHVAERLTLYAADALGPQSAEWAERVRSEQPDVPRAHIAARLEIQSAQIARVDGAIAGTPFLVALIPGYVSYLWQETRMVLRIAALYGRDARALRTAAEVLVLRGARPTVDEAEHALLEVQASPLPPPPKGRRPLRTWFDSIYRLLVFGGFLGPPDEDGPHRSRLRTALTWIVATAIYITTWVLPVTFMLAMSWACESHARELGQRTHAFYSDEGEAGIPPDSERSLRRVVRGAALALSVAVPLVFVAYVNHVRNTVGFNWLGALGALVAVSLVAAMSVAAARR
jgi:hypothetical protein